MRTKNSGNNTIENSVKHERVDNSCSVTIPLLMPTTNLSCTDDVERRCFGIDKTNFFHEGSFASARWDTEAVYNFVFEMPCDVRSRRRRGKIGVPETDGSDNANQT